jgi:hypothetical protein
MSIRESADQRSELSAILTAGNLAVSEETMTLLAIGLHTVAHTYRLMRVITNQPPPGTLADDCAKVQRAAQTIADILTADAARGGALEMTLSGFLPLTGFDVQAFFEQIQRLAAAAEGVQLMHYRPPRRQETPETWLFLALHDLFELIAEKQPGIAGPLERFTRSSIEYLGFDIAVPTGDGFRVRMYKALKRRDGKITVLPVIIPRP